jgi:putative transposase
MSPRDRTIRSRSFEAYFLACCRYFELNPVCAHGGAPGRLPMVELPGARAHGAADALVSGHALYHALGRGATARQTAYRDLFQTILEPGFVDALRAATSGGWALGDASFERHLADALRRRVTSLPRGRPRRERAAKPQQLNLL